MWGKVSFMYPYLQHFLSLCPEWMVLLSKWQFEMAVWMKCQSAKREKFLLGLKSLVVSHFEMTLKTLPWLHFTFRWLGPHSI